MSYQTNEWLIALPFPIKEFSLEEKLEPISEPTYSVIGYRIKYSRSRELLEYQYFCFNKWHTYLTITTEAFLKKPRVRYNQSIGEYEKIPGFSLLPELISALGEMRYHKIERID